VEKPIVQIVTAEIIAVVDLAISSLAFVILLEISFNP